MKLFDSCEDCGNNGVCGCTVKGIKIGRDNWCLSYREKAHGRKKGKNSRYSGESES